MGLTQNALRLRAWWTDYGTTLTRLAVVLMTVTAIVWLGYEFWRLLFQSGEIGAIDLKQRHTEGLFWFQGIPVYRELVTAVYPPASYVTLWPFLGWLEITPARWLWAATTVVALIWLVILIVRESGANTPLQRTFVVLIPLSMYATGATIGNGQLLVHILPVLITGLLMLRNDDRSWRRDLLVMVMILAVLVKPTVTAPFFWIVLFVPRTLRLAILIIMGYIFLTFWAVSFQDAGFVPVISAWIERALIGATYGAVREGTANQQTWLNALDLKQWSVPVSLLAIMILGGWTYRYRHSNIWLLMGVTALVARFWTFHGWYDDLLVLIPMIALFRIAKEGPSISGAYILAGILFAVTIPFMLAPGGLYLLPSPWNAFYEHAQAMLWMLILVYLLYWTKLEKNRNLQDTSVSK